MSYAFYKREFSSKAITLIVPAPMSANPISSFQISKNNFGGEVVKNNFPITRPSSLSSSFCVPHILLTLTI
jgi:hypothetical protein